jgi:hypothetical protein
MSGAQLTHHVNNEDQARSDEKPVRALLRSEIRLVGSREMHVRLGEVVVLIVTVQVLGTDTFFPMIGSRCGHM